MKDPEGFRPLAIDAADSAHPALQHGPIQYGFMSPIFPCRGCGTFIERSTQHYRRVEGQVLCSTCLDARVESRSSAAEPLFRILARINRRIRCFVEG